MKCFNFDLNKILKIKLLGKETLVPPRLHTTRFVTEYILYVIVDGCIKLENNDTRLELRPGDIYIFNKGDFQKPLDSTFCEYYYVHFETESFFETNVSESDYRNTLQKAKKDCLKVNMRSTEMYGFFNVCLRQYYHISNKGILNYIVGILKNNVLTPESKNPENRLAISNSVASILFKLQDINLEEREDKSYYIVKNITDHIENNFYDSWDSEDIENKFFINFDYANRIFKKIMGCSIMKYRNTIRINEAKAKMLTTDMSMGEIANMVGFSNVYYFSRIFKKHEGVSPTDYKQSILKVRHSDV